MRQRGTHQHARVDGARGLAENRHARRVSAKPCDVVMYPVKSRIAAERRDIRVDPLERRDHVEQSIVAGRCMRRFASEFRVGKKAERTEPVIDSHHQHTVPGEFRAIVAGLIAAADPVGPAMHPEHHCPRFFHRPFRRPDVQVEAVFRKIPLRRWVAHAIAARQGFEESAGAGGILDTSRRVLRGIADAAPGLDGLRLAPA